MMIHASRVSVVSVGVRSMYLNGSVAVHPPKQQSDGHGSTLGPRRTPQNCVFSPLKA